MSELRERCEEEVMAQDAALRAEAERLRQVNYAPVFPSEQWHREQRVTRLVAFAKQEQIKGMEHIKQVLQEHHSRVWLNDRIDAEIKQLKEGG